MLPAHTLSAILLFVRWLLFGASFWKYAKDSELRAKVNAAPGPSNILAEEPEATRSMEA